VPRDPSRVFEKIEPIGEKIKTFLRGVSRAACKDASRPLP